MEDDGHAIGYKVLARGTPVRSSDGVQIGTVRRVQDNAREHIFDGIVIDTPGGRRFVDAPEVARIFERAVVLTITAEEAKELPEQGSALSARDAQRGHGAAREAARPLDARPLGPALSMAWIEPVTLTGAHVVLEPAADRHVADLLAAAQDDQVWAWLPWPRPETEADVAAMLAGRAARRAPVRAGRGGDRPRGRHHDLPRRRRAPPDARDRRHLARSPWWRTAINTEAKLLFLGHAFETLGANRVAIKTDIRNERSQAAIARLGAVREGVLRHQYVRRDGTLRDTVMYSVIPEEWPAVRAHLRARLASTPEPA